MAHSRGRAEMGRNRVPARPSVPPAFRMFQPSFMALFPIRGKRKEMSVGEASESPEVRG